MCCAWFVQTLSGGNGFYASESREVVYPGRRLVVLDVKTGEFYDNFTGSRNKDGKAFSGVFVLAATVLFVPCALCISCMSSSTWYRTPQALAPSLLSLRPTPPPTHMLLYQSQSI